MKAGFSDIKYDLLKIIVVLMFSIFLLSDLKSSPLKSDQQFQSNKIQTKIMKQNKG